MINVSKQTSYFYSLIVQLSMLSNNFGLCRVFMLFHSTNEQLNLNKLVDNVLHIFS